MKLPTLQRKISSGEIDTVIACFPDLFGRLVGKRFTGRFFLDHVAGHGTHGCNYLFTLNLEMDPLDGFQLANWNAGFGDFEMKPDLSTLRAIPWAPGSALVLCDMVHHDGRPVTQAPREILRRQIQCLKKRKLEAQVASELEFFLFNDTYEDAAGKAFHDLSPSSDYRIDYHILQPGRDEPFYRQIRNQMSEADIPIESSKGEWGKGQHEINFVYGEPLLTGDRHTLFKHGVKDIAAQHQRSATFMAKLHATEAGNSCHIHVSLLRGHSNAFWSTKTRQKGTKTFRQFLGGLLKYTGELAYFFAPTINAYKRFQAASWAPTKLAWSYDNRTVGFRVVGNGQAFRIENRMPGADANPYLAFAATLAAGQAGISEGLDCGDDYKGNAYEDPRLPALPTTLREATERLDGSQLARQAFGDDVVDHLVTLARHELRDFQESVTDWELKRYFERI